MILQSLVATDTLLVVNRWAAGNLKQLTARPLPVHTDTRECYVGPSDQTCAPSKTADRVADWRGFDQDGCSRTR